MARTYVDPTQVAPASSDDTLAPGPGLVSGSQDVRHDINALQSQVKAIIYGNQSGSVNWYDDMNAAGIESLTSMTSGSSGSGYAFTNAFLFMGG